MIYFEPGYSTVKIYFEILALQCVTKTWVTKDFLLGNTFCVVNTNFF